MSPVLKETATPDDGPERDLDVGATAARLVALLVVSGVVFAGGVFLSELVAELGNDVDFKPFFLVYLLVAVVGFGGPTLAIGLGAAMGEGALDIGEGYEADEPLGFVGYVLGFAVFGWLLHRVAPDPTDWRYQVGATVVAAFVQALFEGFAFVFKRGLTLPEASVSVAGNTVTHGLLLGAIPFVALSPLLRTWLGPISVRQVRGSESVVQSHGQESDGEPTGETSDELRTGDAERTK